MSGAEVGRQQPATREEFREAMFERAARVLQGENDPDECDEASLALALIRERNEVWRLCALISAWADAGIDVHISVGGHPNDVVVYRAATDALRKAVGR